MSDQKPANRPVDPMAGWFMILAIVCYLTGLMMVLAQGGSFGSATFLIQGSVWLAASTILDRLPRRK